mgnify:CR=1 FL=1
MHPVLYNILVLFAYGVAGSIMMAVALGILIKVWDWITPVDEWEELKKGNFKDPALVPMRKRKWGDRDE